MKKGTPPCLVWSILISATTTAKRAYGSTLTPWRSAQKASIRLRTCSNVPYHIKLVLDNNKCQEYPIVPQMETGIKRTLWDVNIDLAR